MSGSLPKLRAWTFLAPGIPLEFFERLTAHVAERLGYRIELHVESRFSGPMQGDPDPFAEGRADVGFLCSPSYLYLSALEESSVALVPAGFVFRDPRVQGEPVYYSDVVVRADHPARRFLDLEGATWGFNDECSLSGHFAALQALCDMGCDGGFFAERIRTGSHQASVQAVLSGHIDAAAIDSTVLATLRRADPSLRRRLRTLDSFGPFPIQPVVVRRELADRLSGPIARAMIGLSQELRATPPASDLVRLGELGLEACVPIDDKAYAEERDALCRLGLIPC